MSASIYRARFDTGVFFGEGGGGATPITSVLLYKHVLYVHLTTYCFKIVEF